MKIWLCLFGLFHLGAQLRAESFDPMFYHYLKNEFDLKYQLGSIGVYQLPCEYKNAMTGYEFHHDDILACLMMAAIQQLGKADIQGLVRVKTRFKLTPPNTYRDVIIRAQPVDLELMNQKMFDILDRLNPTKTLASSLSYFLLPDYAQHLSQLNAFQLEHLMKYFLTTKFRISIHPGVSPTELVGDSLGAWVLFSDSSDIRFIEIETHHTPRGTAAAREKHELQGTLTIMDSHRSILRTAIFEMSLLKRFKFQGISHASP